MENLCSSSVSELAKKKGLVSLPTKIMAPFAWRNLNEFVRGTIYKQCFQECTVLFCDQPNAAYVMPSTFATVKIDFQ